MLRWNYFGFAILGLLAIAGHAEATAYTITDVGTLGGTTTTVSSINNNGQIAGNSQDAGGTSYAFIYSSGHMTSLGMDGSLTTFARNINTSAQVEGNLGNAHIFVWTNGQFVDAGIPLNGSTCKAYGFNATGQATGQVTLPSGQVHGFLYNPAGGGSFIDIGTMGGNPTDFSYGSSVNASGQIEGDSINANGLDHAFIWTNGVYKDLGTFGGPASSGIAINNLGHATGTSQTSASTSTTTISHVFLFDGSIMHDCGTLGGNFANAGGMNNIDQIVGYSYLPDNVTTHAFVYTNGIMTDLNTLIPASSGWTLTGATGINDSGQIIADGVNSAGVKDGFLLTPTPEPATLAFFLPALLLMSRKSR